MSTLRIFFPSLVGRALLVFALFVFCGWGMDVLSDDLLGMAVFLIYVLLLAFIICAYRSPGIDPVTVFVAISFLGFGLAYILYFSDPDLFFFMNEVYKPAVSVSRDEITQGFVYFMFGFISYLIGATIKLRVPKIKDSIPIEGVSRWNVLALVVIVISFWFRFAFKVGIPGVSEAAFPFVGYVYFPLQAFLMLSLGYAFLAALHSGSRTALAGAFLVVALHAASVALLGWKSAIFVDLLLCGLIYVNYQTMVAPVPRKIKRFLSFGVVMLSLSAVLSFGVIGQYRNVVVLQGDEVSLNSFLSTADEYSWSETSDKSKFSDSGVMGLLSRVSGINNLAPIVTYFEQGLGESGTPSFLGNLLRVTELVPEVYYTDNILGYTSPVASINAPTCWGALYIYGGVFGLLVGLLMFGALFQWLFRVITRNAGESPVLIVLYAFLMVDLYLNMIFEGIIVGFLLKNLIAFILAYWVFNFALKMNHKTNHKQATATNAQTGTPT